MRSLDSTLPVGLLGLHMNRAFAPGISFESLSRLILKSSDSVRRRSVILAPATLHCLPYSAKVGLAMTTLSPGSTNVLGNARIMSEEPAPTITLHSLRECLLAITFLRSAQESSG